MGSCYSSSVCTNKPKFVGLVLLHAKIQYHSTVKYTQVYINSPVNTHTNPKQQELLSTSQASPS